MQRYSVQKTFHTLRYQLATYVRSSKPVMPFATQLLLVGLLYAVMPVLPADSYAASATILCFTTAWIGLTYADVDDPVSAQLLTLKLGGTGPYQLAYSLFLLLIAIFAGVLATVQPLLVNLVNSFALYKEPLTAGTVFYGLLLHIAAGFMGTAIGALFHPRFFPDRKIALLLICFLLVAGFVKPGIVSMLPFTRVVTWLLPPIANISAALSGTATFPAGSVLRLAGHCALYGAALTAIRVLLLKKLRFS